MSAIFTGPQLKPSANWAHSTIGLPTESVCCGSESIGERTDAMILSPLEPVSTWTWSIVWQLLVDLGAQIWTLVNMRFGMLAGPPSMTTACVFGVGWFEEPPPPPPPHAPSESTAASPAAASNCRRKGGLI